MRVGAYEVAALLGSGGMGEVYRATDTRLHRDVALKVLPDAFNLDPDRLARFKREAQVLASLNHPNIGAIYGLEQTDGVQALVLELIEGPTLAERLQQGPIRVEEALAIAIKIADALETAHEQGIVHRDLKPANVKLTPNGEVKVLDFGLAKAIERAPAAGTIANSPTLSVLATQAGIIIGTAAYMSPEQAKGAETDRRADIFSFGVVLYEMLTARQPFQGETAAEIMASVLIRDADVSALSANLNPRIPELIKRCLEKQPRKRWQAMGDLRVELESMAASPYRSATTAFQVVAPPLWKRVLPVALAVAITGTTSIFVSRWLASTPTRDVVRFSIPAPELRGIAAAAIALSPDGTRLLYVAITENDKSQLMLRSLSDWEARPIAGAVTTGAVQSPTFSPDGRFVASFDVGNRTLKKIAVSGGSPLTLCTAPPIGVPIGLSWRGNTIAFSVGAGAALSTKERSYFASAFSPDGRWIAYSSNELTGITAQVFVQPFPSTGTKFQVTTRISATPAWSRDGKRLFFAYGNRMFVADIQTSPMFAAGQPVELPAVGTLANSPGERQFDPAPDAQHVLVTLTDPAEDPSRGNRQINVVMNWQEELKQRLPTK